jgi:phage terminase small subunit
MSPRNHAACIANDAILSRHFRSLLAQFGLTPKSKRGLAAGEVV